MTSWANVLIFSNGNIRVSVCVMMLTGWTLSLAVYLNVLVIDRHGIRVNAEPNNLRFIVIGDWGSGKPVQHRVADVMARYAETHRVDMIVSVGDNIYPDGVTSSHDSQLLVKWKLVYAHKSLASLPWYLVVGNHDHGEDRGEEFNQVEYSRRQPRWIMPDLKYAFVAKAGNTTIQFVAFDSQSLLHSKNHAQDYPHFIEKTLRDSTARCQIVFAHHPAWSGGMLHKGGTHSIQRYIVPLLEKYHVDLYLSGHDHNLQHLQKDGSNVDYVISGSGGLDLYSLSPGNIALIRKHGIFVKAIRVIHGFVVVDVRGSAMNIEYFDQYGKMFYSFSKKCHRR